ncbi:VRR-NUC domain-containing protein [Romboutsia sp. 1001285H_161024_C4]|uniref:VRR-NUC domain-containing protein n=1 Tax=Romboutsia sp. 1001285H_161024_C4 TaxID=2787109 RepID=UPI00189A0094|nr:VRR-NUC domain-containing protein [Romboutsia sp. 1001285H_161024_C4]
MAAEKDFENKIKRYLDKLPKCWYFKVWAGPYSKSGIPDIIALINGKFVAIEVKAPNGKASELQKRNIDLINKCGGYGVILYPKNFEEFKREIEKICGFEHKIKKS